MLNLIHNRKTQTFLTGLLAFFVVLLPFLLFAAGVFAQVLDAPGTVSTVEDGPGILSTMGNYIGSMMLSIAASFTYVGGMLLDKSVELLVVDMGSRLQDTGPDSMGAAVTSAWMTIRDLANIAFIFGFVYIGILTIVNYESSRTKRMLASIIIGAILINFSLFFTKVIIDASNILAIEIHSKIVAEQTTTGVRVTNIGEIFAHQMGIVTFYSPIPADKFAKLSSGGNFWFFVMGSVSLMVAAFVFAAGGILLIIRFVALVLIMVFSPILFAATVFPQTAQYANKLWKLLIQNAIFAPAYLLLLFVSLQLISNSTFQAGNGPTLSDGFSSGEIGSYTVILNFVIIIMFLIISLKVAQALGVHGGDKAVSIGKNMRRGVQKGVQGFAGRQTIGRVSGWAQNKYDNSDAKNSGFARSMRFTGLDRSIRNATESGKNAKFGSGSSRADTNKFDKEQTSRRTRIEAKDKLKAHTTSDNLKDAIQGLGKASYDQVLGMLKDMKEGSDEYNGLVARMSHAHFDKLMEEKEENFDDGKKSKVQEARKAHFDSVPGDTQKITVEIQHRKPKDAAQLDEKILAEPKAAGLITSAVFDEIIKGRNRDVQEKVYATLKANQTSLTSDMQAYMKTSYIQNRFEAQDNSETTTRVVAAPNTQDDAVRAQTNKRFADVASQNNQTDTT